MVITYENDYLAHHGVKGQKWGVRRYQNADGSLTAAGREHYGYGKRAGSAGKVKYGDTSTLTKAQKDSKALKTASAVGGVIGSGLIAPSFAKHMTANVRVAKELKKEGFDKGKRFSNDIDDKIQRERYNQEYFRRVKEMTDANKSNSSGINSSIASAGIINAIGTIANAEVSSIGAAAALGSSLLGGTAIAGLLVYPVAKLTNKIYDKSMAKTYTKGLAKSEKRQANLQAQKNMLIDLTIARENQLNGKTEYGSLASAALIGAAVGGTAAYVKQKKDKKAISDSIKSQFSREGDDGKYAMLGIKGTNKAVSYKNGERTSGEKMTDKEIGKYASDYYNRYVLNNKRYSKKKANLGNEFDYDPSNPGLVNNLNLKTKNKKR